MRPCKYFAQGKCLKGARCTFAHGPPRGGAGGVAGGDGQSPRAPSAASSKADRAGGGSSSRGYVAHSALKRHGPSLLVKLTAADTERQQRVLLQCFRHLVLSGQVVQAQAAA